MTYGPRPAGGNIAPPVGVAGTMTDSTAPATLPDLPGGPYDIEFFFDPGCPFAWQTSQWVRRLVELKDIKVGWRFISLKFINENNENMPAGYLEAAEKGLRYHRICAAARDRLGNDAVSRLYQAYGERYWYHTSDLDFGERMAEAAERVDAGRSAHFARDRTAIARYNEKFLETGEDQRCASTPHCTGFAV